jgi:hypothetical protein
MTSDPILHETRRRLRLSLAGAADPVELERRVAGVAGVRATRLNRLAGCLVVEHDGGAAIRGAILRALAATGAPPAPGVPARAERAVVLEALRDQLPSLLALAVPLAPTGWRRGLALVTVGSRLATQPQRLRADPVAVLLDAASLTALAVSGHPLVVSASVLLRALSEAGSQRMVRQADQLLRHVLPAAAATYEVRAADSPGVWRPVPPQRIAAGDRIRLGPGDVVPVDGWILAGHAVPMPRALHSDTARAPVGPGDHLVAGEVLQRGQLELHAEADAEHSRLTRLRAHVRHAIGSRDPAGRLSADFERLAALPVTGAALVLGLTGDTARSAAMLQADPQQGLDLARPVAREAALYALARHGLLANGLEAIDRLAAADTLLLQDTGVLGDGRWRVAAVRTRPAGHAADARRWLARFAGWPGELPDGACLSDAQVRRWAAEGAIRVVDGKELHLVDPTRRRDTWGGPLRPPATIDPSDPALRRDVELVADGRVVARIELVCALRPGAADRLLELSALGLRRIAVVREPGVRAAGVWPPAVDTELDADGAAIDRYRAGADLPPVVVHTILRDRVPPGGLSLVPAEADAGAHGVLLGDPLASLVAARRIAMTVATHVHRQQVAATAINAGLMLASALRLAPPLATTLVHHGFAFALLADSIRIESTRSD